MREMICRNKTDFSDRELDLILHFVDPTNLLEEDGDIIITNQDGGERSGLFIPWGGKNYSGKGGTGKIVVFRLQDDLVEYLVDTLAHEFRHMWQWYHDWDLFNNKEASEMDARVYAELMLRLWIRDDWDWKSLERTKRDNYVLVPEEITAIVKKNKK